MSMFQFLPDSCNYNSCLPIYLFLVLPNIHFIFLFCLGVLDSCSKAYNLENGGAEGNGNQQLCNLSHEFILQAT